MKELILPIITSFLIVLLSTPSFITIAKLKHLFDDPSEDRKLHKHKTPLMGGMMIFAGTLFSFLLWLPSNEMGVIKYLVPSLLIMFFVGMKDDIIGTAPVKKLAAHLVVAFIMVLMADVRLTSLHGLFGVREIPDWAGIMLSVFTYIVVINAFNLIDGVDGLAAGVGLIAATIFGLWFYAAGDITYAVLSFALAGGLLGFLRFNFIKGVSPFTADRNHIHHRLIDLGLSHKQTVLVIYFFNLLIVAAAIFTQQFDPSYAFIAIITVVVLMVQIPFLIKLRKNKKAGKVI